MIFGNFKTRKMRILVQWTRQSATPTIPPPATADPSPLTQALLYKFRVVLKESAVSLCWQTPEDGAMYVWRTSTSMNRCVNYHVITSTTATASCPGCSLYVSIHSVSRRFNKLQVTSLLQDVTSGLFHLNYYLNSKRPNYARIGLERHHWIILQTDHTRSFKSLDH